MRPLKQLAKERDGDGHGASEDATFRAKSFTKQDERQQRRGACDDVRCHRAYILQAAG